MEYVFDTRCNNYKCNAIRICTEISQLPFSTCEIFASWNSRMTRCIQNSVLLYISILSCHHISESCHFSTKSITSRWFISFKNQRKSWKFQRMIEILLLLFSDFKLILLWKRNEIHFCCLTFEIRYFNELIEPPRH